MARPGQERLGRVSFRVTVSEREARARSRRFRPLRILANDPRLEEAVRLLRTLTGASPQTRRNREKAILEKARKRGETLGGSIHNHAVNACMMEFFDGRFVWNEAEGSLGRRPEGPDETWRRALADQLGELRGAGLKLPDRALEAAVFMDFDGAEFEMWAKEVDWGPGWGQIIAYMGGGDWKLQGEVPLSTVIDPYHIYIDVTDLDLQGVEELWPWIENLQHLLKTKPPPRKRGKPRGVPARRETVLGKTWKEIRAEVRQAPSYHTRWETKYVDAEVGRKGKEWLAEQQGTTEVPPRLRREWRPKAKDNFYRQVIVHPSMRDLNLRPRQKGRPRKNSNPAF